MDPLPPLSFSCLQENNCFTRQRTVSIYIKVTSAAWPVSELSTALPCTCVPPTPHCSSLPEVIDPAILTCQSSKPKSCGAPSGSPKDAKKNIAPVEVLSLCPVPLFHGCTPCCVPMLVPEDTPPSLGCPGALDRRIFSRRGIGFSQQSLRLSLFFKELQCQSSLCVLPSALGSWKSAQGLSGGLHSSRQHTLMKENVRRLPGLANAQWAPGDMS